MCKSIRTVAAIAWIAALALASAPTFDAPQAGAASRDETTRAWVDSTLVGADVHGEGRYVHRRLVVADKHPRLNRPVRFVARLTYTGPDSIYLPIVYTGGARTMMPQSWIEVTGLECDAPLSSEVSLNLDVRPLEEEDFRVLRTGESIYCGSRAGGDTVITSGMDYRCPGANHVEFHYRTRGVTGHTWLKGNRERPSARLEAILRRVPHVDLLAEHDVRVRP